MSKIICNVFALNNGRHLSMLYTGFFQLFKLRRISLIQSAGANELYSKLHTGDYALLHDNSNSLWVSVNDDKLLYYDTKDSDEIDEFAAETASFYFKRSFNPHTVPGCFQDKIYPLGLCYAVHSDRLDVNEMTRIIKEDSPYKYRKVAKYLLNSIGLPIGFFPTLSRMHEAPKSYKNLKVLFMVRAWDPYSDPEFELSAKESEDRIIINEMRAKCLKLLKKEFGDDFYGGFAHTEFALENYPDLVLDNVLLSGPAKYISTMREFPICIATTGLHNSIGFKLAEYVAFSKAIISEKLNFEVPGGFSADKNYLEFSTPEQCVACAVTLVENAEIRNRMMTLNYEYYLNFLRPDNLVMRSLDIAMS